MNTHWGVFNETFFCFVCLFVWFLHPSSLCLVDMEHLWQAHKPPCIGPSHQSVCACVNCLYACSLLAQVSGHIAAFEALEVIEALGKPLRSLTVSSAAIGQSIRAPVFQTAQITLIWVRQPVCEVGIAEEENTHTHVKTNTQSHTQAGTQGNEWNACPLWTPTHSQLNRKSSTVKHKTQLHKHMLTYTEKQVKWGSNDLLWQWPTFTVT